MLYGLWSCGGHSQSATLLDRKWGDHASDYNGSGVITIAPVGHEPSIEVDPVAGFVFWVDKGIPGVQRANLDGTSPQTLVTLTSSPGGITVDPVTHTVYWSEQLAGTVSTIPYTGGVPNLLMSGLVEPAGLDLEVTTGRLYIVKKGLATLGWTTPAGVGFTTVFSPPPLGEMWDVAAIPVPEPAAVTLLIIGTIALYFRRQGYRKGSNRHR